MKRSHTFILINWHYYLQLFISTHNYIVVWLIYAIRFSKQGEGLVDLLSDLINMYDIFHVQFLTFLYDQAPGRRRPARSKETERCMVYCVCTYI